MHFPFFIPKTLARLWLFFITLVSFLLFSIGVGDEATKEVNKVIPIGAIIDVNSRIGKEQQVAMEIAAQNYNKTSKTHKLALYFRNTMKEPFRATSLAEELIQIQKVKAIIGMHTWQEAALVAGVGSQAQVPVISFASPAITPPLTPLRWPFLVRLSNNITAHINCIADIVHSFTWQRVIAIYEDDGLGGGGENGMLSLLSEALQDFGSIIDYRLGLPPVSILPDPGSFIHEELIKLIEQTQCRVFIVLQSSLEMATHLFREASQMGLVNRDSAWILPESVTNLLDSVDNKSVISYMEGSLGIKTHYDEKSSEYQDFQTQFRRSFRAKNHEEDNVNPGFYALQAYDSIEMVIRVVERTASENNETNTNPLLGEILSSNFSGLSGTIHFEAGELLQEPVLRIVNVVGRSYKEIDFWPQEHGFVKRLNVVQWPGDLEGHRIPKGWNMPIKQEQMKIAVPGRTSFSKFVKVDYGEGENPHKYSGFCIEIFEKVLKLLEYDLLYQFHPLNVTYPELVQLVYNKTYDAVVGDMTLLAERLQYVDFTVPYAESGLSMIVPEKAEESSWMFTKPFTWQLWASTGVILVYTMLAVWYLERVPNPEFHGSWKSQISTALWFTLSSLFFAHREKMHSNLSRAVMVSWLFLVMILNSSYTASLSSMLTVQQLQPNVTSIEWLKKNNMKVGCDGDSFVRTYLENVQGFKPENIINISSEYSYDGEFKNNSIAAAFLELPYEKVYINTYCKGYSSAPPTTRFGGLGFMFQKGSPVAKDVSKAILQLSENGELKNLEAYWLQPLKECSNNTTSNNTERLKLKSLWILFAISGATSTICLLFSIIQSLGFCQPPQSEAQGGNVPTSDESVWRRAVELAKLIYSRKFCKNSEARHDGTDCSSRWDYFSSSDTTMHQHNAASRVAVVVSTPFTTGHTNGNS